MNQSTLLTSGRDPIVRAAGKVLTTIVVGNSSLNLNPGQFAGTTINGLSASYEEFRFTRIEITIHPSNPIGVNNLIIGYNKTLPRVPGTGFAAVYNSAASRLIAASETSPVTFILDRKMLLGGTRVWYNTQAVPTETEEDDYFQGVITAITSSTAGTTWLMEIAVVCEFRSPTNVNVELTSSDEIKLFQSVAEVEEKASQSASAISKETKPSQVLGGPHESTSELKPQCECMSHSCK